MSIILHRFSAKWVARYRIDMCGFYKHSFKGLERHEHLKRTNKPVRRGVGRVQGEGVREHHPDWTKNM